MVSFLTLDLQPKSMMSCQVFAFIKIRVGMKADLSAYLFSTSRWAIWCTGRLWLSALDMVSTSKRGLMDQRCAGAIMPPQSLMPRLLPLHRHLRRGLPLHRHLLRRQRPHVRLGAGQPWLALSPA